MSARTFRIVVLGSANVDMVVRSRRIPAPVETVTGGTFLMNPGGKGANQAVAVARWAKNAKALRDRGSTRRLVGGAPRAPLRTRRQAPSTFTSP